MKLILALLALAGVAFAEPVDTRVVGGTTAAIEDYPFIGSVQLLHDEVWWYHACGGTLLTRVIVLTTARYLWAGPPADWRVRLGARTASSGGSLHPVSEIVIHPEYHSNFYNDLAIIRLAIPAVYSNTVQRAGIAGTNYILPEGTPVHAAGWGSGFFRPANELLRRVDMNIINHDFCTAQYAALPSWPNVTERMICAGIDGRSTCDVDAGGPVIHNRDVVVGVIGFSYSCGHPDYPAVHARVSDYASWIGSFS